MTENLETWKPVPGFPVSFEVSSRGNVREVISGSEPRMLKLIDSSGRITISFRGKQYYVHRLVAAAFLPNPANKKMVIHIDGDHKNNNIENLKWSSRSEDAQIIYKSNVLNGLRVRCIETGDVYATIYSAYAYTLIPREAIVACADGKAKSCFGLHFEYVKDDEKIDNSTVKYRSYLDMIAAGEHYSCIDDYLEDTRK